jgi:hypothetical protein
MCKSRNLIQYFATANSTSLLLLPLLLPLLLDCGFLGRFLATTDFLLDLDSLCSTPWTG